MNTKNTKNKSETHPLFPSGQWEGFYTYQMGPDAGQHKMEFALNFKHEIITGSGSDDIGAFTWLGTYDKVQMTCKIRKAYTSHVVDYQGNADENGIWGFWSLNYLKGGFHIWPKENKRSEKAKAILSQVVSREEEL